MQLEILENNETSTVDLEFDDGEIPYSFCYMETSIVRAHLSGNIHAIPPFAFAGCTRLVECTLPPSTQTICVSAFENCTCLRSIKMDNIVSVGPRAFRGCSDMEERPQSAVYIHHDAFGAGISETSDII